METGAAHVVTLRPGLFTRLIEMAALGQKTGEWVLAAIAPLPPTHWSSKENWGEGSRIAASGKSGRLAHGRLPHLPSHPGAQNNVTERSTAGWNIFCPLAYLSSLLHISSPALFPETFGRRWGSQELSGQQARWGCTVELAR